jgi:hypothetical protein
MLVRGCVQTTAPGLPLPATAHRVPSRPLRRRRAWLDSATAAPSILSPWGLRRGKHRAQLPGTQTVALLWSFSAGQRDLAVPVLRRACFSCRVMSTDGRQLRDVPIKASCLVGRWGRFTQTRGRWGRFTQTRRATRLEEITALPPWAKPTATSSSCRNPA